MKFVLHAVNRQRWVTQVVCLILLVTGFAKSSWAEPNKNPDLELQPRSSVGSPDVH